jgi:hypothetical protein
MSKRVLAFAAAGGLSPPSCIGGAGEIVPTPMTR